MLSDKSKDKKRDGRAIPSKSNNVELRVVNFEAMAQLRAVR
jgi:hypothetical protein